MRPRLRRMLATAAVLGAVVGATWLVLREVAYTGRLPMAVKERMPAHWRMPWGLSSELRDGIEGMYSPDGSERALAAHRVGNLGAEAAPAIPYLVAMLADEPAKEQAPPPSPTLIQSIQMWIASFAPPPKPKDYEEWWELKDGGDTAADALADVGPAAVEPLIAALKDPLPRVRGRAALALGLIGDERATELKIRQAPTPLAAMSIQERDEWVGGLCHNGYQGGTVPVDPRVFDLLADYMDRHPDGAQPCAYMLAEIDPERAVEPLVALLEKDLSNDARSALIGALIETKDPRALAGLKAAMRKADDAHRPALMLAIGSFHDEEAREVLLELLVRPDDGTEGWKGINYWAWEHIKDWRDPRIVPLFAGRHGNRQIPQSAATAMVALGPPAAAALIEKLADPDAAVRQYVVWALAEMGDPQAYEPLLDLREKEADEFTRGIVTTALARNRDPRALKLFTDEFAAAPAEKKGMAAFYLASTRDAGALDTVYRWWLDGAGKVMGRPLDPMKDRLDPAMPGYQQFMNWHYSIAYAFLEAGDARAVGMWVVHTRLKSPRNAFQHSLSMIDGQHPIDAWGNDFAGLAKLGAGAVGALEQAMAVDNPEVQTDAAAALLVIGDEAGLRSLWAAWPGLHFEVRRSVAAQIGRYHVVEAKLAKQILAEIAQRDGDRIVRREVFRQLAQYRDKASRAAYQSLVAKEPCPSVREFARLALDHGGSELQKPTHFPLTAQYGRANN